LKCTGTNVAKTTITFTVLCSQFFKHGFNSRHFKLIIPYEQIAMVIVLYKKHIKLFTLRYILDQIHTNRLHYDFKTLTSQKFRHHQNFLFGFSFVFDTHNFIIWLQPHFSKILPIGYPTAEALLPPISWTLIIQNRRGKRNTHFNLKSNLQ